MNFKENNWTYIFISIIASVLIYFFNHFSSVLGKTVPTSTRIQALDVSVYNDSIYFTSIDVDKNIQKIAYDCSKISKIINQTTDEEYQGCDSLKAN